MKVSDIVYGTVEGVEDFQYVIGVSFGGGYDWDELEAWYSPSRRRFFWLDDSGCSCNSLGDGIYRIDDFDNGTRDELVAAIRKHYDDSYGDGKASDCIADLAKVKSFRASKTAIGTKS